MKIVMYHYIREYDKNFPKLKFLNKKKFIKQLNFFEKKFKIINYDDWQNIEKKNYNFKKDKILLTFDDGLREHYSFVYKELKKRNLTGLFFIPSKIFEKKDPFINPHKIHILTSKVPINKLFKQFEIIGKHLDYNYKKKLFNHSYISHDDANKVKSFKRILNYNLNIDQSNKILNKLIKINKINLKNINFYLSKKNLKEMVKNKMIIGTHTHSHPVLSSLSQKKQSGEIKKSIKILSNIIKRKINLISYPYGIKNTFNLNTFKILKKNKFKYGFTATKINIKKIKDDYKTYLISRKDCNQFQYGKAD